LVIPRPKPVHLVFPMRHSHEIKVCLVPLTCAWRVASAWRAGSCTGAGSLWEAGIQSAELSRKRHSRPSDPQLCPVWLHLSLSSGLRPSGLAARTSSDISSRTFSMVREPPWPASSRWQKSFLRYSRWICLLQVLSRFASLFFTSQSARLFCKEAGDSLLLSRRLSKRFPQASMSSVRRAA